MIRPPAVAGRFYPSDPSELTRLIDGFSSGSGEKAAAIACVVPHAGYVYSGAIAGAVYAAIKIPRKCILLGPRHSPQGQPVAIMTSGSWETPLGLARLDEGLALQLARECTYLREDAVAHEREHSLEVEIPFLQRRSADFQFVPIVLGTDRYGVLEDLGRAIATVVAAQAEPVLLIASSDLNHYESDAITRVKDERAIEQIVALDPRGLYDRVRQEQISMCGYAAVTAMLVAAKTLGATEGRLLRYATSGDINGDREKGVGYAGIIIR